MASLASAPMHAFTVLALAALSRCGAQLRFDFVASMGRTSALRMALGHLVLDAITATFDLDGACGQALLATRTAPWASGCPLVLVLQPRARVALLPQDVRKAPRPLVRTMTYFRWAEAEPAVRAWVRRHIWAHGWGLSPRWRGRLATVSATLGVY